MSTSGLQLPPSLDLPPHLSAHKYFFVCTLTVAAWDTLVLSPRTWKLLRTPEWPVLKILFHFMRLFMPIEFTIVGVAFFDTNWSSSSCEKFYLFEPICTAILLAAASAVHVLRIHAYLRQESSTVPLLEGQGCIAGIKDNWVGVYWVFPTLLYTVSLALALLRSVKSLQAKPLSPWRLMLRDGLNLYGAIWIVNMTNMLFLFIMKPTDERDPVKTIITSMAAVLTTSMTLRIILGVRGTLSQGGSFVMGSTTHSSSRTTHVISTRSGVPTNISRAPHTYTLDELRTKPEGEWTDSDNRSSVKENKESLINSQTPAVKDDSSVAVKITVDREVGYDLYPHAK
ncbi:uncharacterized protein EV420DRAFT_1517048 [Desarmillaria tabescens]|uniref:Transmembrane protein n=1 Tax=Armillaria tabescens TaxID=1929756 RepID=A0AA39NFB9_ARMTA|nr:uncharacterized protein EV420DRAFT_1517048 [Desarmillaria tabescens]KAK0464586.1 hypothetical protein EV420DRAFT_1517048 [Desarmillaria tabescens]